MTKSMNTGYRIYKVNDVIGRVVPEDSAFWDIRVPPVVETWLWLDVGRSESQPERISPNIDVFLLWLSPTEERERDPSSPTIRHPGKKQLVRLEQFVQQCTWDAFPRAAGATWPCIYSPTALVLGEWRTIPWRRWHCVCLHSCSCTTEKDCCRLVLVGQHTVLQHSVGLRRWMRFPNRRLWRQTHCITVLVSLCLSHYACFSAASQCVASLQLAFQPWLTRV